MPFRALTSFILKGKKEHVIQNQHSHVSDLQLQNKTQNITMNKFHLSVGFFVLFFLGKTILCLLLGNQIPCIQVSIFSRDNQPFFARKHLILLQMI